MASMSSMADEKHTASGPLPGEVDLTKLRQHYAAALVESEDQAQRILSLGVGAAMAMALVLAPALGPLLATVWMTAVAIGAGVAIAARKTIYQRLRHALLMQMLTALLPLELELWERLHCMRHLPAPVSQYVEHFLGTYVDLKRHVREGDQVELGQVQLIQSRDQVLDFLDLAERTGAIRNILDTMSHRLADEDQIKLRQRFGEQCAGLQQIAQSFDRSLGNLVMAQVLGDELGEMTIEDAQARMTAIEEELAEVKQSLAEAD